MSANRSWAILCHASGHLLRHWADQGDDNAFAELVRREVRDEGRTRLR